MKKHLLIIIALSAFFNVHAQFSPAGYSLTWGQEQRQKGKTTLGDIVGSNEDGFVVLKNPSPI